jgi:uncharacterized coiled-coil DUF342 family protein
MNEREAKRVELISARSDNVRYRNKIKQLMEINKSLTDEVFELKEQLNKKNQELNEVRAKYLYLKGKV